MNDELTKPETAAEVLAEMRKDARTPTKALTHARGHADASGYWADRIERALSAQGEAVAFRYRYTGEQPDAPPSQWYDIAEFPNPAFLGGRVVEYAYTHPVPSLVASDEVLIAIKRGEGYKDVHPQMVAEDALRQTLHGGCQFEWRVVTHPAPARVTEEMVRFCPGCGSVGPVPTDFRDCCPDGGDARMIPATLAEKCKGLFQIALVAALEADHE